MVLYILMPKHYRKRDLPARFDWSIIGWTIRRLALINLQQQTQQSAGETTNNNELSNKQSAEQQSAVIGPPEASCSLNPCRGHMLPATPWPPSLAAVYGEPFKSARDNTPGRRQQGRTPDASFILINSFKQYNFVNARNRPLKGIIYW